MIDPAPHADLLKSRRRRVRTLAAPGGLVLVLIAGSAGHGLPGAAEDPPGPRPIDLPGVENAFRLGPNLLSGGRPRGAEAFQALRAQGVRTVLSVDGILP